MSLGDSVLGCGVPLAERLERRRLLLDVAGDHRLHQREQNLHALAGEADVRLAINDALATFPAGEIIVAVHPTDEQGVVESMATANTPSRSVGGLPVRVVVVSDAR